uniref:DUF4477 domain-containing protein n=1 Tax=Globodera pallida TaxID=36090 RepID=A0A183CQS6_GLOPA
VVLLTQHMFTRELRIARNNCHYLVLMRNPAGALQVRTLGTQLLPAAHFPTSSRHMRTQQQSPGDKEVSTAALANISPYIKNNVDYIQRLTRCRSSRGCTYQTLIKRASTEQLLCLVECALNVLRSRVPTRRQHLHRLRNQAQLVRALSKSRSAHRARSLLLRQQTGRGVPALAGLLASVVLPVLADRVVHAVKAISGYSSPPPQREDGGATVPPSITATAHTAKRVLRLAGSNDAVKLMNDDERLIHYQQEFKRYQKLLADEQERPTNVRLAQLPTDAASKTVLRATPSALSSSNNTNNNNNNGNKQSSSSAKTARAAHKG